MSERRVLTPSADHPITVEPHPGHVVVRIGDRVLADTRHALTLREANYPAVQYIPRADIDMAQLRRSDHASYCPYKGDASYFDVPALGDKAANAIWTYEHPYDAVAAIAGHVAFYPDRATISEE
jgi:uncharacterized protein (DUF427 family)